MALTRMAGVSSQPSAGKRMAAFDVIRGFSVVSMVLFHLCYDLRYLYGIEAVAWFRPPLQDVWRASISWVFLCVAGCMCSFSRNGLRRGLRYLAAAFAVWLATTIVAVDTPISFGIIFCMGASTLVAYALDRLNVPLRGLPLALALFTAFVLCLPVGQGYLGIGSWTVSLPHALYESPWLSFLGFPGPGFASGDYYPILPFCLMYLTGTCIGRTCSQAGYPRWFQALACPPLEWVGRHALPIYLVHQPLILALLELGSMLLAS